MCGEGRGAVSHKCSVEGCVAKWGQTCHRVTAMCGNCRCRGPHFAQANICPKERKVRYEVGGGRPPLHESSWVLPHRRMTPPSAAALDEGEMEVGMVC